MKTITIILTISITVFILYIAYIWRRFGVQKSISDSYYRLKPIKQGWLFTLFCIGFAYPIAILASNLWITPAAFLIILVGVARAFKDTKFLKIAHMTGAYGGVGLGIIGLGVEYGLWWLSITFAIISFMLLIIKVPNKIWWVEIVAFVTVLVEIV